MLLRRLTILALLSSSTSALAQTMVPSGNLVGDQTWTAAGSPYLIAGDLTVPSNLTLTIQSGVEVRLGTGDDQASGLDTARTELRVAGTVIAQGATFTSGAASPAAQDHYGLVLLAGSSATLTNVTLQYGASCVRDETTGAQLSNLTISQCRYGLEVVGGSPTVTTAELSNNTSYGLYAHSGASVVATGLTVEDNGSYGLYATNAALDLGMSLVRNNGNRGIYIRTTSGNYTSALHHNTIYGNGSDGVYINEQSGTLIATVRDNMVLSNSNCGLADAGFPSISISNNLVWGQSTNYCSLSQGASDVVENPLLVDPAGGDFAPTSRSGARFAASDGTDIGAFPYGGALTPELTGHLYQNTVLTAAASPHLITGDLTVEPSVTLTIEPGAEVRFAALSDLMDTGEDSGRVELSVSGTLVADGTASLNIRFTSNAQTPARGDWYGIHLLAGASTSIIDYATLEYGRYNVRSDAAAGTVVQRSVLREASSYGVYATSGGATFDALTVRDNGSYGIYTTNASGAVTNSLIFDNGNRGIYGRTTSGNHTLTLTGNTIVANGSDGIYLNEQSGTLIATVRDNLVVSNNNCGLADAGFPSISISNNLVWGQSTNYCSLSQGASDVVENPLLVDLAGRDLRITRNSPARQHAFGGGDIGALPFDGAPTVGVQGHLFADTTWSAASPIDVLGDITVEPGVTLTIEAGAQVRFAALSDTMQSNSDTTRTELIVLGRLVADGTLAAPIVLTSANATPSRGDWYGVRLTDSAANCTIDQGVIEYARYGVESQAPSTTSITQTQLRENSSYGAFITAGALVLDGAYVHNNGSYGIYSTNGAPDLLNVIVANNGNRGIYIRTTSGNHTVDINHATVFGNGSDGIYLNEQSGTLIATVRNSVVASNNNCGIADAGFPSVSMSYNNVWGHSTDYCSLSAGPNSLSANPQFVNTALGNFHLLPNSTSIDNADPATALAYDSEGNVRPLDGDNNMSALPDIGAFEYNPSANRWPIADGGADRVVTSGLPVAFSGAGSIDPDGSIVSYQWDFGDGTQASGLAAMHTFSGGTDRVVTLTVTDNAGAIDIDQLNVEVNLAPVADAGAVRFADPGEVVTFDASGSADSDGSIVSYQWDFGDGAQASGVSVTHQYSSGGGYTVTLTVTDDDGASGIATTTANITGNDGAPPAIGHTPITDGQPAASAVQISADVTDSSGVSSAVLYFRVEGAPTFSAAPMTNTSGSVYAAQIPSGSVQAPAVEYYIQASDAATSPNIGTHPPGAPGAVHRFTVNAPQGPAITHTAIGDGQPSGSPVGIQATVTAAAGLSSVNLFYRAQGAANFTMLAMNNVTQDVYQAQIPGAQVLAPAMEYYIEATDQSASTATEPPSGLHAFTVTQNDTSGPAITHTPISDGQPLAAEVIVAANVTDASGVGQVTLHYRVSGGGGFAQAMMMNVSGDLYEATIPAGSVTLQGVEYYLEAADLASPVNLAVAPAGAPGAPFSFTVNGNFNISPGDLIVSEVMNDPSGDETVREWFELYNTTSAAIDIEGFTFTDNGSDSFTISNGAPLNVPPSGYLVLGRSSDMGLNGGVNVDYVYSGFALSNRDDEIVISAGTIEVDRVEYDDGATFPNVSGRSISLDPATLDFTSNDDGGNWCEASAQLSGGDYGTPGQAGAPCQPEVDVTAPVIVHTPIADGQQADVAITISAVVTDDVQLSDVALFYRTLGGGAFTEVPMADAGADTYQAELPQAAVTIAGVEYYIRATDAALTPNVALAPSTAPGQPHSFAVTVDDTSGPQITHTKVSAEQPQGIPVPIMATVTDPSGVAQVNLHYRASGGAFQSVPMQLQGGSYSAQIPAASVTVAGVEYYLSAEDGIANASALPQMGDAMPFTFDVYQLDETPPVIVHNPVSEPQPPGEAVLITAEVTDESGVAEVRLYFRTSGGAAFLSAAMESAGGDVFTGEVPAALVEGAGIDYYLEATDASADQNLARDPADAPANVHTFSLQDSGGDTEGPAILHLTIDDAQPLGEDVEIIAEVVDSAGVKDATLHFRAPGGGFAQVPMQLESGDRYRAVIPGASVTLQGIEYYLSAADTLDNVGLRPQSAPDEVYRFDVVDSGGPVDPEGGCGCRSNGRPTATIELIWGMLLLGWWRRRRSSR